MKAGKALNERKVEIRVQYKPPAASIHGDVINEMRNELVVSDLLRSKLRHTELSEDTVQLCGRPAALWTTQMCACHITACFCSVCSSCCQAMLQTIMMMLSA